MLTICGVEALSKMKELLADVALLPMGEYAEVGVYQGGSASFIAMFMVPSEGLFLFDTFEGMPETGPNDNHHVKGDFSDTSEAAVTERLSGSGIQFAIFKGRFPETAGPISEHQFRFVHLDVDIYQSYKDGLEFFYPRMVKGGVIIFDDYGARSSCLGASIAVDEFMADKPEKLIHGGGGSQMYIVKE